mmetsp:Transcript_30500/g.52220  ORF Transcript_30500/g.52220 Transcript_30500/m.52220 type:complete len:81 (+) Transcript_30500:398-640(+)
MAVLGMEKPLAMVNTDHMMARESSADIRCVDVMMIDFYCLFKQDCTLLYNDFASFTLRCFVNIVDIAVSDTLLLSIESLH